MLKQVTGDADIAKLEEKKATLELELEEATRAHLELSLGHYLASDAIRRYRNSHRSGIMSATERYFSDLTHSAYPTLSTQPDRDAEVLMETIERRGQAIYLPHHPLVVDIAQKVCDTPPVVHEI